jgi:hypothetical protein
MTFLIDEKRVVGYLQDFPRTGSQQHVLGFHSMMVGDGFGDPAVRVSIAIGVLEGIGHGFQHGVGRPIGIFVEAQLGRPVVIFHGFWPDSLPGVLSRPENHRLRSSVSQSDGHSAHKGSARNDVAVWHWALLLLSVPWRENLK